MTLMFVFSSVVYSSVNNVTQRALTAQRNRMERRLIYFQGDEKFAPIPPKNFLDDPETINEIRERVLTALVGLNIFVLLITGGLSYFLAEKTLQPIETMLNKQKRFISDAAHEMKTPLTTAKADIEVNLRDKDLTLDKAKTSLKSAIEEIDKLNSFVNKLLDQSRYQTGVKNNSKQEFILKDLVLEVVNNLNKLAQKKAMEIKTDVPNNLNVLADKHGIELILSNLIENAIKYGDANSEINVLVNNERNNINIIVKNTGVSISKEDIKNVFEPFFRADKSRTKQNIDGYGLGLAIVQEIVRAHNGSVQVTSEPDGITQFAIKLPISKLSV